MSDDDTQQPTIEQEQEHEQEHDEVSATDEDHTRDGDLEASQPNTSRSNPPDDSHHHANHEDAEHDPITERSQVATDDDPTLTDRSTKAHGRDEEEEKVANPQGAQFQPPIKTVHTTSMQSDPDLDSGGDDHHTGDEHDVETSTVGGQTHEDEQQEIGANGDQLPVEVTIMPDGFKHLELFDREDTIASVKSILSERFKLDVPLMRLALGDLILEDERALYEYRDFDVARMLQAGIAQEQIHATPLSFTLTIELPDGIEPIEEPKEQYKMPDIIKVVINRDKLEEEAELEEEKQLNGDPTPLDQRTGEEVVYVQVIRDNLHHPKPFLGGFRHKYYGTIYHHASSQTARKKKKVEVVKFHRETQTIQIISRSQQTNREAGTQMERRDLIQDHSNDVVIMSKPYFTADQLEALRDNKAREIQCFLRQCFAWRRVRRLREQKAEKLSNEISARAEQAKLDAANHARQIQRRMHPRSRADFAVLFSELESWRLHETQRIKESGLSAQEIAAALEELLTKEVKLLQTIDRLKLTAAKENKWARTQSSLEKMASPKEWSSREGDLIEVETPFTIRAKELVDLYNGLCLRNLSRAQRVDILLHIKYTVKEFDCELSREIVELIKREEDLLRRQRSEESLEGLRKRLQNLFLHFIQTPTFNPEASHFQRIPMDGGVQVPTHALSSSLAKPAMLTRTNTITIEAKVAGRTYRKNREIQ